MNLKDRLANWLTDGRFALYRDQRNFAEAEARSLRHDLADADITLGRHADEIDQLQHDINALETGLREIIALQTPSANATVRRMALLAQNTLDRFGEA